MKATLEKNKSHLKEFGVSGSAIAFDFIKY
jgi:hypothetical protein